MFGLSFDKTTNDKSSMHTSYYWAWKGGKKINISVLSSKHETDAMMRRGPIV